MQHHRSSRGFTIVELIVVIVIIGILTAIATISLNKIAAQGRDSQRKADVQTIAESLESYFMKNGEYPSCSTINNTSLSIKALSPSVNVDTLTSPTSKTKGTSLRCGSSSSVSTIQDRYIYIGDGSQICTTGSSCASWQIQYLDETDNTIASISSRHQTSTTTIAAPAPSTPSMLYSNGVVKATPSIVTCSQGQAQYATRSRLNNGTWSNYSDFSSRQTAATLAASQGDKTDFQTLTRCYLTSEYVSDTTTGSAATFIVPIVAPGAPTVALNTGNRDAAIWSWSTVSCPGSLTSSFRYIWSKDDTTGWRAWSSASTTTSNSQNTTDQGYNYQLKAQERCNSPYTSSDWSTDSNVSSYIRPIDTPGTATSFGYNSSSSSNAGYSQNTIKMYWTEPVCGTGTSKRLNVGLSYAVSGSAPPNASSYATGFAGYPPIWTDNGNTQTYWKSASPNSYLTSYYSNASSVSASDLANPSNRFGINSGNDNPAWVAWGVTSSNPLVLSSGDWSSSKQNTKVTFARVYTRYACFNTVTQRYAVGGYAFTPAWSWSGY